ncbi:peptide-methionine (S)-S-oxide reductase MsrA [Gammaproteobacteria bacterium]|nr:peptide-methionine (S)-S-oxide reductase MsrA [Gammaproteobacteria bacterium]
MKNFFTFVPLIALCLSLVSDENSTSHLETIVLGSGCFWGAEKGYEALEGVEDAVSGYADGYGIKPTYREITKYTNKYKRNNFAEVVKVTFNKEIISLRSLLEHYYESHDPTQLNRQGNDIGTQYRSTILYTKASQKKVIDETTDEFQKLLNDEGYGEIQTLIKSLDKFYDAEEYHQDYIKKNPKGYCPDHSTGVAFNKIEIPKIDNSLLLSGKYVLVIDSQDYCPYCEKFKNDVANNYQGSIPMVYRTAIELDGLSIQTPTWATPTIVFLENGAELFSYQGYMEPELFYKALGKFKLGNSEAYDVAFNQGTDSRFCKEYQIFKNTPDGVFIDKLSGAPLFDTRDRFVSRSGWLSFTAPVPNATYELPDNSYGMKRTEVKSISSNIHLGHVFDDGPNGMPRYCINATVLEFVAREDIKNS